LAPDDFVTAAKKNSSSIEKQIISFISKQNSRAEKGEITTATVGNCLKAVRLLLEMNDVSLNWKKIRRVLPRARRYALDRVFERALNNTLQKIKESIGGNPTVLWTGNGYHTYQPVSGFILEEFETFYEFTIYFDKDLTSLFIQYAEEYFTDYAADRLHNPSVKSCLVRIPGSLNSKCITTGQDARVKIVQKWDGHRTSIHSLLRYFRIWLIQKRIDDMEELRKQEKKHTKFQMTVSKNQERTNTIKWIEKGILEHPLLDHRKFIIWRILSPYLLNIRRLPKEEAYSVMKEWLDKCDKLEKLNFNPKIKIKDGLKAATKGYFPISMEKLKEENRQLYYLVLNKIGHDE
jgi:hypothetical protein